MLLIWHRGIVMHLFPCLAHCGNSVVEIQAQVYMTAGHLHHLQEVLDLQ